MYLELKMRLNDFSPFMASIYIYNVAIGAIYILRSMREIYSYNVAIGGLRDFTMSRQYFSGTYLPKFGEETIRWLIFKY